MHPVTTKTWPTVRRALVPACILLLSLYATLRGEAGLMAMDYNRSAISAGAWWRLLSAHLVDGSLADWSVNMFGFIAVVVLSAGRISARNLVASMVLLALIVSGGLYFLNPEVAGYAGFSGVLHGLLTLYILLETLRGSLSHGLAATLIYGKVAYEQLVRPDAAMHGIAGFSIVVDAHLYGAAGGFALAIAAYYYARRRARHPAPFEG
ncbi:MAG: rhombosortase [Sulfurifustaceae bacterium]